MSNNLGHIIAFGCTILLAAVCALAIVAINNEEEKDETE